MPDSTENALVVAITEEDIQQINDGGIVLDEERRIAIYKRGTDDEHQVPEDCFLISMSERAVERVDNSKTVSYGIRQIGDVNQELFVRKGRISERVGTSKTTEKQLMEDGMTEEEADRYSR